MKMGVLKLFNSLRLRCNHTYCIAYIAVYTNYVAFLGVYCHSMFCVLVNVSTAHHRNSAVTCKLHLREKSLIVFLPQVTLTWGESVRHTDE